MADVRNGRIVSDWEKVYQAVAETTVPRHEYMDTQGTCHKRNCPCHATMQRGNPEAALALFTAAVTNQLKTVELFGMTQRELDEANMREELTAEQDGGTSNA